MAVIGCLNCAGKLRFPDDMPPRRVKCTGCGHSFMAGPKGPIAGGASSATVKKLPGSDSSAVRKKPEPPPDNDFDFVEEEVRPTSKRRDDDDEEDDRPRKKPIRLDDDEDDRPRKKPARRDDDDDRPRSRRRDREDDDDYDDRKPPRGDTKAQYSNARTGIGLVGIGFWCQVGALGIVVFTLFLFIVVGESVPELFIPAGLAGLANWILGAVGFSFLIAGPRKGNLLGLTIALAAVTAIHLFLAFYIGFAYDNAILGVGFGRSRSSIGWLMLPTQMIALVFMVITEIFNSVFLIAAIFEIARFVLFTLVVKEYGRLTRKRDLSSSSGLLLVGLPVVLGVSFVLFFILKLIAKNSTTGSEGKYIAFMMILLMFGGFITVYVMSALLCGTAKGSLYKRK